MPTDVLMPQMGESIFEGTITKWLKKPGDKVERDEPLFEISTDKVDAEIPSPAAGVLKEIKVEGGATVQINTVVAVIEEAGGASAPAAPAAPAVATPAAAPAAAPAAPAAGPATDVVMPQMGESIFEGTITKWLKQVGDKVERDEPLFEISTDKVDAEIPSPAAGTLTAIKVEAGSTVQINTVVATIGGAAGASAPAAAPAPSTAAPAAPGAPVPAAASTAAAEEDETSGSAEHGRTSPLVRKIAKDKNVDLNKVTGTGAGGRITKEDLEAYLAKPAAAAAAPVAAPAAPAAAPAAPKAAPAPASAAPTPGELVPLSKMRSIIAQRMVESKRTSPHVHTVFKIDFTKIVKLREKEKNKYEQRNGVKLTYMPFITRAVVANLKKLPIINAQMEGDAIRYPANINIGIAVALEWGLIVPVIKQAEEKSFLGIARSIADLAERARGKKLKPDEVSGGTFTITNPGIFGEQFGTPIINQPESAILGVGGLFKEPAVVTAPDGTESIAIRHFLHLTLGFDHRTIDGADAGKFMSEVKKTLENWSEDIG
ncbi:2-oxoglutarate dehydrogenase, E2 component, dihydrolipoamide succinyltransferase [Silvibacterium dinghuense]|uniref:Dihydrolipoamide acetyltransferase component of pyruvate dehydrogenase complex n=1 Tax=Silvibacterium dinghuense TaxID=1560006 RepID=A0A4Q1SJL2_9BACT|nr:2-oxoglutarate dehydrogenase, E2 component, dihydrolipoamide succinyltransferase [Silvibacterium dinghuense]RXS97836.1 2-oxoglutarate dehydrogenase, E2 component, dihydrolipoamide succinyltransferase [Silvibacterium dinghuense]GGH02322.1 dihydrolipoamide acetyltransferase component of pyruvate dehydrogenase complex [Silvibacterium dinghuense]